MGALLPLVLVVVASASWRMWPTLPHRRLWAFLFAGLVLSAPLLSPAGPWILGPVRAGLALGMTMKVVDVVKNRVPPGARLHWWTFAMWFCNPPRTEWEPDPAARKHLKREAVRRWARLLVKVPLLWVLLHFDARHTWPWPLGAWAAAFQVYFMISGLADLASGNNLMLGFRSHEVFRAPFLARSPADFWGHRWNLSVSGFFRRHVFMPLAKNGHVYIGAFAVFLASGVAHEYFAFVCVPWSQFLPGRMTAFFLLQGLAVMAATWWRAHYLRFMPTPAKIGAHFLWMAATVGLFVTPLDPVIMAFERFVRAALYAS